MLMKYIIMADGKERRWHNYSGMHKWQIKIENENLLERTVRLVHAYDANATIIITSHDKDINIDGATRYEPQNNKIEIDRFTWELIDADTVFLYGDSFYTEDAIRIIAEAKTESILFFGSEKRIFAIKIADEELFRKHVQAVKEAFLQGKIKECIGWQVYQSFQGLEFGKKQIANNFILIRDGTCDFNEPTDYIEHLNKVKGMA